MILTTIGNCTLQLLKVDSPDKKNSNDICFNCNLGKERVFVFEKCPPTY